MKKFIMIIIIVMFLTIGIMVGVATKEYLKWISSSIVVGGVLVVSLVIRDILDS